MIEHQSDYVFQRYCEETYGVNRGVYNAIDQQLYAKGCTILPARRRHILCLLRTLATEEGPVRFGKGQLVATIDQYVTSCYGVENGERFEERRGGE